MNKTAAFAITLLFATALGAEDAQKLKPIPEKLVVLTFDDGNVSDRTVVAPILKEQGFGATFYITAGWVGRRGRVTWQQVRELDEMGFEIGNHTTTHPNMLHISEEEIRSQIAGFDRALREQGIQRATTFAYPGEHHDRRIVRTLAKAGYANARRGVTPEFPLHDRGGPGSVYNPLDEDPFLIPSVYCRGDLSPSREEFSRALGQARGGKISVFIYHGVPDVHAHCTTSLELFKRDMQHLKDEGCTVIAMRDLAKYVDFSKRQKDIYAPIIARLGITATDLKCDTSGDTPVFSWKTKTTRPQTQSAYQLLVASSPEKLAINQADLWDSGRVNSDRTKNISYGGKRLAKGQSAYWKVRCWNNPDQAEIDRVKNWIATELIEEMRKSHPGPFSPPSDFSK